MYLGETREIRQEISDSEYMHLADLPVDIMRNEVAKKHVYKCDWGYWYGCRIALEDGKRVVYHRVSQAFDDNSIF